MAQYIASRTPKKKGIITPANITRVCALISMENPLTVYQERALLRTQFDVCGKAAEKLRKS